VIDAKTQRAVTAHVTVFTEKGDTVISGRVDSIETVLSTLVDDRQRYYACVTAEGYRDTCANFTQISEVQIIRLEPIQVKRFVLQNMFFATDKTDILPTSDAALQELYNLLNDNPDIRIRIIGHTDDVGKDDYNLRLSRGRSESVKKEMVKRGIASERIETAGRGELDPIVPNDSDEHRQMNRRVEIEILSGGSVQLQIRDEQLTK
jgi:outer membrane protein OmpA-like peptidoglycan-associated protein